jgi:hypothetical protein
MKTVKQGRWLSVTEAARHASHALGRDVRADTVQKWLQDGLLHTRIAGTTVRILTLDLDAWLVGRLELARKR